MTTTNVGNLRIDTSRTVVLFTLLESQKGRASALLTYREVADLITILKRLGPEPEDDEPNEALDLV